MLLRAHRLTTKLLGLRRSRERARRRQPRVGDRDSAKVLGSAWRGCLCPTAKHFRRRGGPPGTRTVRGGGRAGARAARSPQGHRAHVGDELEALLGHRLDCASRGPRGSPTTDAAGIRGRRHADMAPVGGPLVARSGAIPASGGGGGAALASWPLTACISGPIRSIGSGKTIVEFCSLPISSSVCR
jgi:hypothetical protein